MWPRADVEESVEEREVRTLGRQDPAHVEAKHRASPGRLRSPAEPRVEGLGIPLAGARSIPRTFDGNLFDQAVQPHHELDEVGENQGIHPWHLAVVPVSLATDQSQLVAVIVGGKGFDPADSRDRRNGLVSTKVHLGAHQGGRRCRSGCHPSWSGRSGD